jgi:hypothetical protein
MVRLCAAHHPLAPPIVDDTLRHLGTGTVEAVERSGRHIAEELSAVGGEGGAEAVEDFDWQAAGIGWSLQHDWGYSPNQHRFGHAACAVLRHIAGHFAAARRMADVNGVPKVEMGGKRCDIGGVGIHVVALSRPWPRRSWAMTR